MILIEVTYKKPIETVDQFLGAHRNFLEAHYQKGNLICSGPQSPRTGGIILTRFKTKAEAEAFTKEDPFFKEGIGEYRIVQFDPVKFDSHFKTYIS